jgi:hypothetical protein
LRLLLLLLATALTAAPPAPTAALPVTQEARAATTPRRPLVAVIDSGVARTRELAPWLVAEYDVGSDVGRTPFKPRYDHGTMVATILLREARQPVDIVSIRIDDPAGCPADLQPPCQLEPSRVAKAIRKATALGVDAINLSLKLEDDRSIVDAVRDAAARHILVVLAAGNDGLDHPGNLPAARAGYPNTILVGALDAAGRPWSGTNRPEQPTDGYLYTWQRGVGVPTVAANGERIWGTGTSFAAPAETGRRLNAARRNAPAATGGADKG